MTRPTAQELFNKFAEKNIKPMFESFNLDFKFDNPEFTSMTWFCGESGDRCGCAISAFLDGTPKTAEVCEDFEKATGIVAYYFYKGFDDTMPVMVTMTEQQQADYDLGQEVRALVLRDLG